MIYFMGDLVGLSAYSEEDFIQQLGIRWIF